MQKGFSYFTLNPIMMAQIECTLAFLLTISAFYIGIFFGMLRREFFDQLAHAIQIMKKKGIRYRSFSDYKDTADTMRSKVMNRFYRVRNRYQSGIRVR